MCFTSLVGHGEGNTRGEKIMEIMHSEIKMAIVLTFKDKITYSGGFIDLIPEEKGKIISGILMDDVFLDIKTNKVYEILFVDENENFTFMPEIGVPYVYGVTSCVFESFKEQEEMFENARRAVEIYEGKENITSFERGKQKYKRKHAYKK